MDIKKILKCLGQNHLYLKVVRKTESKALNLLRENKKNMRKE